MTVNATDIENYKILDMLEDRISCWLKTLAYVKKFTCRLRAKIKGRNSSNNAAQEYSCALNAADIHNAEICTKEDNSRMKFASLSELEMVIK